MAPSPRFHELLRELADLHDRKNADYAGEEGDPFRNFRKAEQLGVLASTGCLIRMSDKWSRIESLVNKGEENRKIKDESLVDTVKDLAVYALIWICLREQEMAAEGTPHEPEYGDSPQAATTGPANWPRPFDSNPVPGWVLVESFPDGSKTYARDSGGQRWHASPGTMPPTRCSGRVRSKDAMLDSRPCDNDAEFIVSPRFGAGVCSMPCSEHLADSIPREDRREYIVNAF